MKKTQGEQPASEQVSTLEFSEERACPVTDLVADFAKRHTPEPHHKAIEAARLSIVAEQDGFNRTRNYTAWKVDGEAASSAGIEPVKGGFVLVTSNMEKRRPADIVRTVLDRFSRGIYPPVDRKDLNTSGPNAGKPKLNHNNSEREAWIASLGFSQTQVNEETKAKRWVITLNGSDELLAAVGELVPEKYAGTTLNVPTMATVQLKLPVRYMGRTIATNLPDPENAKPEAVATALQWLVISTSGTDALTFKDPNARVPRLYNQLIAQARGETPKQQEHAEPLLQDGPVSAQQVA